MFTGIIQDVGRIAAFDRSASGARATIETTLDLKEFQLGDSIAVNGCCLTAIKFGAGAFDVEMSSETLAKTAFDDLARDARVNLEPALRLADRLGGHLVQGHVDGVGTLVQKTQVGDCWDLSIQIPLELMQTVIHKGSIALDGISLTVATLGRETVTIAAIPHTMAQTTLGSMRVGSRINIETDVIGKYVQRLLTGQEDNAGQRGLSIDLLKKSGFL